MKTHAIAARSVEELKKKVHEVTIHDFKPNLAIVFASVKNNIKEIQDVFKHTNIKLIGASSCGEIYSDGQTTEIYEEAIVAMLINVSESVFGLLTLPSELMLDYELGIEAARKAKYLVEQPGIIVLASGLHLNGQALVEGLQEELGKNSPIFGGLAGDDAKFEETYVFTADTIMSNGIALLCFDTTKIEMTGMATSGWISLGADLVVSSAKGNIVNAIDGQPALDMYLRYLNVNENEMPSIGVEYPLMIKRADGTNALRAVMSVDKEARSLVFAGTVPEGSVVTFSSSPGFEVIEHTRRHIEAFKAMKNQPDCLLVFSCMARHLALGPLIAEEIEAAVSRWPKPMAGLFTYGEIGSNPNVACDFHNQTFTMVMLRQKK